MTKQEIQFKKDLIVVMLNHGLLKEGNTFYDQKGNTYSLNELSKELFKHIKSLE